ncbi:MAG: DegT/DnrJ/EryC1/StrS family aminotransferase [Microcoleaceae cyanobacterium MO_207.B10]|nr:DegT/DnrJ/EryC1/StrS family aminotransferase [Microcoleaceae cyanobacterium MO_207.B10]
MLTPVEVLQIICLIPIIGGSVYSILSVWTIGHFFRKTTPDINTTENKEKFNPPVTVLKPVRGIEKELKSNLHSISVQDWPEYQIVYSVQDPEDAALPIIQEIQTEVGSQKVSVEQAFAEYVGTKYAIAVNSGSSGLEIILRLKKVEGTTVLVPTNTNFATIAMVIRAGGKVQYLDMDEQTFAPSLFFIV